MVTVLTQLLAGVLIVAAIGVPILETWRALLLAVCLLAVASGTARSGRWRMGVAVGMVAALLALRVVLPRADIAEAHNAFLVLGPGEALERGLPAPVFHSWKEQFDALYPPDSPPDEDRLQWRNSQMPPALFTQSADAIWRTPRYTRQVDAIDFDNLGDFRGGFANDTRYNFWKGELLREWMPFYAMYELTPSSVGSALAWTGQVFWERDDGQFEEIVHREMTSRRIAESDAGTRVFAAFFPKRGPFHFRFEPSLWLRVAGWLERCATLGGALTVLFVIVRPRWGSWSRATALLAVGYVVMAAFLAVSAGKYLGGTYPPHGGGDDGLVHDGWGHTMALLAGSGDVIGALRGLEDVYWFTPGTRYLRMVEKVLFGDTNLLFTLIVALAPVVVFQLIRTIAGARWAWMVVIAFCLLPAGNLSFVQYLSNAKLGYGEAIAGVLFLGALTIVLNRPDRGREASSPALTCAGLALAASMFIRPNFALVVVWIGIYFTWVSWRHRTFRPLVAFGAGLAAALWMPFHNWYYGDAFVLIASSATQFSLPVTPAHYVRAALDLLRANFDSDVIGDVQRQLHGWLWSPGFVIRAEVSLLAWALHLVKLLALIITAWTVLRWAIGRRAETGTPAVLGVIAVAALLAHLPMLFAVMTHYRYAMLAWDLSLVVLIGQIAEFWRTRERAAARGISADRPHGEDGHLAVGHTA